MRVPSRAGEGIGIAFQVFGTPHPKGSMKLLLRPRPCIVPDSSTELRHWANAVAASAMVARGSPVRGGAIAFVNRPLALDLTFVLERPKTVKRAFPSVTPDLDKLVRATLDPLTGLIWDDDSRVVDIRARKTYDGAAYGLRGTGAIVDVWPMDGQKGA